MDPEGVENRVSLQVIADHARALAFAVADGGRPGNDGRGSVLRRILRRAARHGRRLGFVQPFLADAADIVIDEMGGHYRELIDARDHIRRVIRQEEERFNETLDRGILKFEEFAAAAATRGDARILGTQAFQLHDTFGFPVDLTEVMAEEKGLQVDLEGFGKAMEEQRARARDAGPWNWVAGGEPGVDRPASAFVGYDAMEAACRMIGLRSLGGNRFEIMLDRTPFYAESGGQVGDRGEITGEGLRLRVVDTQPGSGGPVHVVELVEGSLDGGGLGDVVFFACVDEPTRRATMLNHTATHLLHAELRRVLGDHATQAGSLVSEEKLRFDFHHEGSLSKAEFDAVEQALNEQIGRDEAVKKHADIPIEEAREMGAVSMFGEKYGETVRVVEVEGLSMEFCGGTHLDHIGEIGLFRFTSQSAVGAGVRRVEAVTGAAALRLAQEEHQVVRALGELLSAQLAEIAGRVEALQADIKKLQRQLHEARKVGSGNVVVDLVGEATMVGDVRVVASRVNLDDRDALLQMADGLREKLGSGVGVLGGEVDGKVAFLCVVTDDLIQRGVKAGDVVKAVASVAGGSGGGKPHLAQAGGKDSGKIDEALSTVVSVVEAMLG
jgi:alanyl-tRNA synthetase